MTNKKTAQNINYFSYMVDSILYLIASSLPFKEAARTSVLSRQWRHIWRSTKNIEFEETFFVNPDESDEASIQTQRRSFIQFAQEWILNYRESSIQSFTLTFSNPSQFAPQIFDLIKFSLSHKTKSLNLNFSDQHWNEDFEESNFCLPEEFYKYKALEILHLDHCTLNVSFVNFQVLKEIFLSWIELKDEAINTLLKNSPLLENFALQNCFNISEIDVTSSNPMLKFFIVDNCIFPQGPTIYVDGPQLQFFKYVGKFGDFHIRNQTCLQGAFLDFGQEVVFRTNGDFLSDLLEQVTSANVLTVDTYLLQVLPYGDPQEAEYVPADLGIKHLILNLAMHPNELPGLKLLLQRCPLLESLSMDVCTEVFLPSGSAYLVNPEECLEKNANMFECFESNLNMVQVNGFKGTAYEIMLVKYFLELASSLKKMNIYVFVDDEEDVYRQRAVDNFFSFEKTASENVDITIY